jgi:hypothetical protein
MESSDRTTFDELKAFGRYARRLPSFLTERMTPELARDRIRRQLERREETFTEILDGAVFANPRSPYRAMLEAAGIERGDVVALIAERGLEGALERLHDAGVYATLDEFKGRVPIERSNLSLDAGHVAFDNPLIVHHFSAKTGGSRSARRRVPLDLNLLEHDSCHDALFRESFGLWGRPFAMWRVKPPSTGGINNLLRHAKLGTRATKWFDPYSGPRDYEALKYWCFTAYTVWSGRLLGVHLVRPEHCPVERTDRVVEWIRAEKAAGRPALVDAQAGLAVRACSFAVETGIDISGTFFRLGGEPMTQAKLDTVSAAGCQAISYYSMAEAGRIAVGCPNPTGADDMHFLSEKLAVLQREHVFPTGLRAGVFFYTTLLPSTPKVMINVESDDFGVLERRSCGCEWDRLGLSTHLHGVRSHEKLTSDGNTFMGSDLFALIEEVLPARFGGRPTDYQLVEEEERDGRSHVSVVVRPEIGAVPDAEVLEVVIEFMRAKRRNQLMADFWDQSNSVRVVRREPHITAVGKSPPLYVKHAG